jgi:small subunit ribosomal protein S1
MQELMGKTMKSFSEGSIVKGKVLQKRANEVLVDIGYKSEGVISLSEFEDSEPLEVGSEVEVLLERLENDEGMVVLSKEKAAQKQNWEKIVQIFNNGGLISGKVKAVVKGGLMLNVGVEAFLPGSQVDIIAPKDLRIYEGKTLECKIVKLNEERKNVVLSRRELIEAERAEKRSKLLSGIEKGSTVKGTVKNITDFGAFIDLDGLDGLLHITDMSWSRLNHPSELLKVGAEIEVLVLDIDREKERVSLGLKQKTDNPWDKIAEKYPVNLKVKGKVTNLVPSSSPASKASCTSASSRGPSASRVPPMCSRRARRSRPLCSASARKTRRSPCPSASSTPTRGKLSPRSTRPAPASRARSATSPLTARSSSSRKASMA